MATNPKTLLLSKDSKRSAEAVARSVATAGTTPTSINRYIPKQDMQKDLAFYLSHHLQSLETEAPVRQSSYSQDKVIAKTPIVGDGIDKKDVTPLSILISEAILKQIQQTFSSKQADCLIRYEADKKVFMREFDIEIAKAICDVLIKYNPDTFQFEKDLAVKCVDFGQWYAESFEFNFSSGEEFRNKDLRSASSKTIQIVDSISENQKLIIWQDFRNWMLGKRIESKELPEIDAINTAVQEKLQLCHLLEIIRKQHPAENGKKQLRLAYELYRDVSAVKKEKLDLGGGAKKP